MTWSLIPEDPPPPRPRRERRRRQEAVSPMVLWLVALRERPGVWHRCPELQDPSVVGKINGARYPVIENRGDYEATGRGDGYGRYTVWARYRGDIDV